MEKRPNRIQNGMFFEIFRMDVQNGSSAASTNAIAAEPDGGVGGSDGMKIAGTKATAATIAQISN